MSEVNYKALAQHYGFDTFLLDLTNDVRDALFFATSKWEGNHFEPLNNKDINKSEANKYGVIYHAPDWWVDYINGVNTIKFTENAIMGEKRERPWPIDSGKLDGVAYQIGLQPFYRCHVQNGYVYPMKMMLDLNESKKFEKICFPQSEEFSNQIFEMMDQGRQIYPNEGITLVNDVLDQIKTATVFSEDDLRWAYEIDEADRTIFPTVDDLRTALMGNETERLLIDVYGGKCCSLNIVEEEIVYKLSDEKKRIINEMYNNKPFLDPVGGKLYLTPDAGQYRKLRYKRIYGMDPTNE